MLKQLYRASPFVATFLATNLLGLNWGQRLSYGYGGPLEAPKFKSFSSLFFVYHNPTECSLIIVTTQLVWFCSSE